MGPFDIYKHLGSFALFRLGYKLYSLTVLFQGTYYIQKFLRRGAPNFRTSSFFRWGFFSNFFTKFFLQFFPLNVSLLQQYCRAQGQRQRRRGQEKPALPNQRACSPPINELALLKTAAFVLNSKLPPPQINTWSFQVGCSNACSGEAPTNEPYPRPELWRCLDLISTAHHASKNMQKTQQFICSVLIDLMRRM